MQRRWKKTHTKRFLLRLVELTCCVLHWIAACCKKTRIQNHVNKEFRKLEIEGASPEFKKTGNKKIELASWSNQIPENN